MVYDVDFDSSIASLGDPSDTTQIKLRKRMGLGTGVLGRQGQAGRLEAQQSKKRYEQWLDLSRNLAIYNIFDPDVAQGARNQGEWLSRRAEHFAQHDAADAKSELERNESLLAKFGIEEPDERTLEQN